MYRRGCIKKRFRKRTLLGFFVTVLGIGVLIIATLKFNGMTPFNEKEDEEISNCSPIAVSEGEIEGKKQQGFGLSHWQKAAAALGVSTGVALTGAVIHRASKTNDVNMYKPKIGDFVRPIKTKSPLEPFNRPVHYPYHGYRFKIIQAAADGRYYLKLVINGETETGFDMGPYFADELEPEVVKESQVRTLSP